MIVIMMGNPYVFANSKSLWSWAGTDMIAPVPYSMRTKFPIYMGILSLFKGFIAYFPVNTPSFSILISALKLLS